MRKLKGGTPGRLFQLKFGVNSFGKMVFPFYRYGLKQFNEEKKLIAIFRIRNDSHPTWMRTSSVVEYYPEGTYGIILASKRTRAIRGSIAYVIAMIGDEIFKISADCISFVEQA